MGTKPLVVLGMSRGQVRDVGDVNVEASFGLGDDQGVKSRESAPSALSTWLNHENLEIIDTWNQLR